MTTQYNYKSFTSSPYATYRVEVDRDNNEHLTPMPVQDTLNLLARDITFITDMVNWQLSSYEPLRAYIDYDANVPQCNSIGRILGFTIPTEMMKDFFTGQKGLSRYEMLFQDRLIRELKSWAERFKVTHGESEKYVSQGWERTADDSKPDYLSPEYHLSAVNNQFAYIPNNPIDDGEIRLRVVVDGNWYELRFPCDTQRFAGADKVTLPNVRVAKDGVTFDFTAAYIYNYRAFSERYIVGVDVGITDYATAIVWDTSNQCIVHTYTMSRRARSLQNSITATHNQVVSLHQKYGSDYPEIKEQRSSLSRKRRELAILVAQEIADIAEVWDNALIAVEDLSFLSNTMENGRWNRGELMRWLAHYHELNGGRVLTVNAYNTSQECPYCHGVVKHPRWKDSYCPDCGTLMDRDIAASAVIAQRAMKSAQKAVATRKKAKNYTTRRCRRTPVSRDTLVYPGRDRTKNCPTPSRKKNKGRKMNLPALYKNQCSAYHSDDGMVYVDGIVYGDTRTLEKQHDNNSTELLL